MGKTINDWLKKPLYIYTFGLFFLVYKTSQYFGSFDLLIFLEFLGGYCLINYAIVSILKKTGLYKYGTDWLILIWILVLFTDPIIPFLTGFINPYFIRFRYLSIIIIMSCLLLNVIKGKISTQSKLTVNHTLNIFIFILIGITIVSGIQTYQHENSHNKQLQSRKLPSLEIKSKKDIVWILLDEYTSPASLRSQFHFHDPLVDSLKDKGFFVFDELRSLNDTTIYSVNSLFNLDDSIPISNFMYAAEHLNKSEWVRELENNNYEFINLDFLNIGGYPKFSYLRIFPDSYIDQVLSNSILISCLGKKTQSEMPYDDYNQKIIKRFIHAIHEKRSRPTFIWTHLLLPHEPFYRDSLGDLNKSPVIDLKTAPPSEIARQYTNYLSHGNAVVLKLLNQIPSWKNKIVVISGDHGARMLISPNDPRRKETFGAVYYPGMDPKELNTIKYLQQIPFHLH